MAEIKRDPIDIADLLARVQRLEQDKAPRLVRFPFSNLISNGGVDAGLTGWTPSNATLSVSSGKLSITSLAAGAASANQQFSTVSGRRYLAGAYAEDGAGVGVAYVSLYKDGTVFFDNVLGNIASSASNTFAFSALSAVYALRPQILIPTGAGSVALFDNLFVWEADPTDDAPWLRLPRGWTVGDYGHVYRDGTYLHPDDYTEITVLDQTWIKPLVAPGVDTQFDIWGYQA